MSEQTEATNKPSETVANREKIEYLLTNSPVKRIRKLPYKGMHESRKMILRGDIAGVWKPSYKRLRRNEVAAYEIAKIIGLGHMVPPTIERTINDRTGSLQHFIEDTDNYYVSYAGTESRVSKDDIDDGAFFDTLIGSADRHDGNILVKNGRAVLIDNGAIFSKYRARSAFIGDGGAMQQRHMDMLIHFVDTLNKDKNIRNKLLSIVDSDDFGTLVKNAEAMLKQGSINKYFHDFDITHLEGEVLTP